MSPRSITTVRRRPAAIRATRGRHRIEERGDRIATAVRPVYNGDAAAAPPRSALLRPTQPPVARRQDRQCRAAPAAKPASPNRPLCAAPHYEAFSVLRELYLNII